MAEKAKKPLWLKLILWVVSLVLTVAVLLAIGCGFLYIRYQVNVFTVTKQIKTLNEEVDMSKILTNEYTAEDTAYAKELIEIDPETNSYTIPNDKMLEIITSIKPLKLTDKQVGALMAYIIDSLNTINLQIGGEINLKEYGCKVMKVDLTNVTEKYADFNIVLKIELAKVKENMNKFPLNWIEKAIPSQLYISSNIAITHTDTEFGYTTESKGMSINNLSIEDTADIFKTFNNFIKIGSADEFNKTIGDTFVNMLIGTEESNGLAYSLRPYVTDFSFDKSVAGDVETEYFVIKKL